MKGLSRRAWLAAGLVGVLAVAGGAFALGRGKLAPGCGAGDRPVSAAETRSPLLSPAQMKQRPDKRLARLVASVEAMPAPFGSVLGGIGFDYGQYLRLAAVGNGLAATTKDNALFAVLSSTLRPRWGVENSKNPHAWDAGDGRLYNIELPRGAPPVVSAYDVVSGQHAWCRPVGSSALKRDDPLSTQVLDDGGLLLLAGAKGHLRLSRLASKDGHVRWGRPVGGADEGDFVSTFGDSVVAGGRPQYELAQADAIAGTPARTGILGLGEGSGSPRWSYRSAAGSATHVVGVVENRVVASERTVAASGPTGRIFALDTAGRQAWSAAEPSGGQVDVALRAGVVLVRSATALLGYDAGDGALLWRTELPGGKQAFPYGFTLEEQPMLDGRRVLLAGTEALLAVDVRTGATQRFALPTDGISTTFWPYQLVVTKGLIAVVTNTGAVVVAREDTERTG